MEFKYELLMRPFGIGTYPVDGFVKYELDENTRYGILVYKRKLTKDEIDHFDLSPIISKSMYDLKEVIYYEDEEHQYKAMVQFISRHGREFVRLSKMDINGHICDTEGMTIKDFMEKIESGEYQLCNI